ncbi:hypothetical protein ACIRTB_07135 [Streptomyces sp. NPDC101158]|uniref:hypothetical protein n=1 Tax=Streptomyces sp. NPDC101158 TaxID=3366117 RepID=UPI0037F8A45D
MRFRSETGILLATLGMAAGALTFTGAATAAAVPGGAVPSGAARAAWAAPGITHAGDASVPPSSQRVPATPNGGGHAGPHTGPHAGPHAGPNGDGQGGVTAHTGERLWLLGGLGLALAATGVVAGAAIRSRTESSRTEP